MSRQRKAPRSRLARRSRRLRWATFVVSLGLLGFVAVTISFVGGGPEPEPKPQPLYFLEHREALSEPSPALAKDLTMGLASWETPGPAALPPPGTPRPATPRPDRTVTFFVSVKNNGSKDLAIADILVAPTPNTAPGVRLTKEEFKGVRLESGASREIEIRSQPIRDSSQRPASAVDPRGPGTFGVRLYAVVAYEDDVRRGWQKAEKPPGEAAFKRLWGRFALVESFEEIPPDLLIIRA